MVRSLLLLSAFHAPLEVVHEPLGVHKPEAGKHGREKSKGYNHQPTGEHVLKCFADQKQAAEAGPWELPCDCRYSLYDKKQIFRLWWNMFLLQHSLSLYGKRKKNTHLSCLWKVLRSILETVRGGLAVLWPHSQSMFILPSGSSPGTNMAPESLLMAHDMDDGKGSPEGKPGSCYLWGTSSALPGSVKSPPSGLRELRWVFWGSAYLSSLDSLSNFKERSRQHLHTHQHCRKEGSLLV